MRQPVAPVVGASLFCGTVHDGACAITVGGGYYEAMFCYECGVSSRTRQVLPKLSSAFCGRNISWEVVLPYPKVHREGGPPAVPGYAFLAYFMS